MAISYDPVDVLSAFATKHGITFPLLSDVGSRAMRAIGVVNSQILEQQAANGFPVRESYFGLPYPGTFVLDEAGVVRDRWFEQNYRVRPTPSAIFAQSFGGEESAAVEARARSGDLSARVWSGSSVYHPLQLLHLNVDLAIPEGLHIYTQPTPEDFVPLSIEIESIDGLEVREFNRPPARLLHLEALGETFHVLEGNVRLRVPIILSRNLGDVELNIGVGYQACSDTECFLPSELTLTLPLRAEDNVR